MKDFTTPFDSAREIAQKYDLPAVQVIDETTAEIPGFRITAPLVGGFSTGKSSLINAVIGEKLLSTKITPETSVPTEITFGKDTAELIKNDGTSHTVPLSEFDKDALSADEYSIVRINTSNEFFAKIPSIKLVDMPGFDSGISVHDRAIDDYLPRSLAYIIAVSADEGTLRESILTFLNELKIYDVPIYAVITKSDKTTPEELSATKQHIEDTIKRFLKKEVHAAVTSSRSKCLDVEGFQKILLELQKQSSNIADSYFTARLNAVCAEIEKYLSGRLSQSDLSLEDIRLKKEQLESQLRELEQGFAQRKDKLAQKIRDCAAAVRDKVSSDLHMASDSLESTLLSGGDVSGRVNSIVRTSIAEITRTKLEPIIQKYIKDVSCMINSAVSSGELIDPETAAMERKAADDIAGTIAPVGTAIATGIANAAIPLIPGIAALGIPVVGIAVALGTLVGTLITLGVKKGMREKKERERKQVARQKISELIPRVADEASANAEQQMLSYIGTINEKLDAEMQRQAENCRKALSDAEKELADGIQEKKRTTEMLTADLNEIRRISNGN